MAFNITGGVTVTNTVAQTAPNAPTATSITRLDTASGTLAFTHTPNPSAPHSSFRIDFRASGDQTWETFGTAPANPETVASGNGTNNHNYDIVGLADLMGAYEFSIVALGTTIGSMRQDSARSNTLVLADASPNTPSDITITDTTVDDQKLVSWNYTSSTGGRTSHFEIERFKRDVNLVPSNVDNWEQIATSPALVTEANTETEYSIIFAGFTRETQYVFYRIRAVFRNGSTGDWAYSSAANSFTPVTIPPVSDFRATVNTGVGVSTSISLVWTPPSIDGTAISGYLLEYQRGDNNYEQVNVYAADATRAEVLPPQQGLISLRLTVLGLNGGKSTNNPVQVISVSAGSITDDAIYNGDREFMATRHFPVTSEDFIMDTRSYSVISGGTVTENSDKSANITGQAGTNLVVDFSVTVTQAHVDNKTHFWLDLSDIVALNNPTRVWDVDNGNVVLEVFEEPAFSNRMYQTGLANTFVYIETGNKTDDVRFYAQRNTGAADEPMYVSRSAVRLTMRRTFTFRAVGVARIRMTFLADSVGYPSIPVPLAGSDSTTGITFAAHHSAVEEQGNVNIRLLPAGTGSTSITFTKTYQAAPVVMLTPHEDARVWTSTVNPTGATVHITPTTVGPTQTLASLSYYVRGY